MLAPIPVLEERAHALNKALGEREETYEVMKVGEQVNRYAIILVLAFTTLHSRNIPTHDSS